MPAIAVALAPVLVAVGAHFQADGSNLRRYFFISIIYAAISWASLPLSGKFGIVACGKSKKEAIISELIVSLLAMDANDDALLYLAGVVPTAWHSEHHRSDNRRPFSTFCA